MTHLIIAGHGKQRNGTFDPGASGYIKKGEHKYVVEDLFPAMKNHLSKNHNVVFFHEHKVSNYGDLVSLVKKHKATQVTEIHFDAHTLGSSASGGHVIIHKNFTPDKVDLALRDAIKNMVGVRYTHKGHEGISGRDNLYNVNVAAKNGITYRLIELGFGTNETDAGILVNDVDQYAKELVKAIVGEVKESESKPAEKPVEKPKPSTKPTTNKVTLKSSATRYATGESIPTRYKNKTYTVIQERIDQVLLKEIMSWVYKKDVSGYVENNTSKPPVTKTPKTFKVGQKVKIKSSADKYSRTNVKIPARYKNKTMTIQQLSKDDVLIKEVYSWVKKSHLE